MDGEMVKLRTMTDQSTTCDHCDRTGQYLHRCSRCHVTYYCDRRCQKLAWSKHKLTCLRTSQDKEEIQRNLLRPSVDRTMTDQSKTCDHCDRTGQDLHRCSRCHVTYYCDRRCQKLAWSKHKLTCLRTSQDTEEIQRTLLKPSANRTTADQSKTCDHCDRTGQDLHRCSRCHLTYYCDRRCQKLDWSKHKLTCLQNSQDKEERQMTLLKPSVDRTMTDQSKTCDHCDRTGQDLQRCSRCHVTYYCDRRCQKLAWSKHKLTCSNDTEHNEKRPMFYGIEDRDDLTEDERRVLVERWGRHMERVDWKRKKSEPGLMCFGETYTYPGGSSRWGDILTAEELSLFKRNPPGSYEKAKRKAEQLFPTWDIVEYFDEVFNEFDQFPSWMDAQNQLLIGFMFMYHNHNIRYGIYLKDAADKILHVEFYLDNFGDSPYPYFSYRQVRPGHYIFLKNPRIHLFNDGQIGIRINDPSEVCICDINTL